MENITLTRENLNKIIKDVIESAHESMIYVLMDTLENEGSFAVIEYLHNMQKSCQNGGYGLNFDENIKNIVDDCFEQYSSAGC